MSGDTECEIKIGDVDSATTGMFVSIKPYNEQVEFGDMDLIVWDDIKHQGDHRHQDKFYRRPNTI